MTAVPSLEGEAVGSSRASMGSTREYAHYGDPWSADLHMIVPGSRPPNPPRPLPPQNSASRPCGCQHRCPTGAPSSRLTTLSATDAMCASRMGCLEPAVMITSCIERSDKKSTPSSSAAADWDGISRGPRLSTAEAHRLQVECFQLRFFWLERFQLERFQRTVCDPPAPTAVFPSESDAHASPPPHRPLARPPFPCR
jgi:hypothetical protein